MNRNETITTVFKLDLDNNQITVPGRKNKKYFLQLY